jgi:hypothetical protein
MAFHNGGGWNRNRKRQTPGLFGCAVPWALRAGAADLREICQRK